MALPGVNVIIEDQLLGVSRTNIPVTPRVAVIGRRSDTFTDSVLGAFTDKSADAPDLDPYAPQNATEVIERFGVNSDIHRAWVELQRGGASNIVLIPLPSDTIFTHGTGTIASASYTALVGGNTLFEDAFSAAETAQADVIVPWGRGAGPTEFQSPATPGDDAEVGFHADNSSVAANSWALKVAAECEKITTNSHPCFAVMGIKPYIGASGPDGSITPMAVNTHLGLPNLVDHNGADDETLKGLYVSVVATEIVPLRYNQFTNWGFSNGACAYAAAISKMDSWSAPTAKTIFNVERVRYNPTRTQQLSLIDKGVVPVALSFNRNASWVDAQTFARDGSDYKRLTTLRIVYDAVQMVRQISQKFVGEPASTATRNALDTAITSGLRGMQQLGALLSSDKTITYLGLENKAIIDLVLQPAFELRNIEVRVAVQL